MLRDRMAFSSLNLSGIDSVALLLPSVVTTGDGTSGALRGQPRPTLDLGTSLGTLSETLSEELHSELAPSAAVAIAVSNSIKSS